MLWIPAAFSRADSRVMELLLLCNESGPGTHATYRDEALAMEAWYHFFIAVNDPPARGSHGKLHWTAGIAGRSWRPGGRVAARRGVRACDRGEPSSAGAGLANPPRAHCRPVCAGRIYRHGRPHHCRPAVADLGPAGGD